MAHAMGKYYERVSDYDLEYLSQSELDIPYWRELVLRYTPARVLELACGSGRIGLELLKGSGSYQLDGLDLEANMIEAYQRKLERELPELQDRVHLYQGNMCDYDLPAKGSYDLIFLPFNSICHLYEIEEQLSAFHCTYQHLAPGGRFVVDTFLPDLDYLSNALNRPSNVYLEDEIEVPEDFTMHLYTTRKYDPFEQTQHITWIHEKFLHTGESERYHSRLDMHVFFPRELQMLFIASGLQIDAIYGDYDWRPFGRGTRQIVVGRKPTDA